MSASLKTHPRLDDWIRLDVPGYVTLRTGKVEIGQRINTALLMSAAAELSIAADRLVLQTVVTGDSPDEGMTSGSNSIQQSAEAIRLAAVTARRHLLALAASAFECEVDGLVLADGLVRERAGNRSASFWELLPTGRFAIDVDSNAQDIPMQVNEDFAQRQRDKRAAAIASGELKFVHDWQGLNHDDDDEQAGSCLHARVVRPPHAKARLLNLDESLFTASEEVFVIRDANFVAVAAADEFVAIKAAQRLARVAQWDLGTGLDDRDIFVRLRNDPAISLAVVDGSPLDGPVPEKIVTEGAQISLHHCYERGYQMHASIGPSAAIACMQQDMLYVWTHSQGVYPLRDSLAELLQLEVGKVRVEHALGAGCYGHNGADDAALDAALVARALPGRKVLLKWSRDDEHAWEPYASAMAIDLSASLDQEQRIVGWSHETYSDTHGGRPRAGPGGVGPARLLASQWITQAPPAFVALPNRQSHGGIHRNADPYYDFADRRIVKHLVRNLPLRTSAMRTLGGFMNVFAIESFIDELAHAGDIDALDLRLRHLGDPRACALLQYVADNIDWQDKSSTVDGVCVGKGLAFGRYKNRQAYVAVAVEVSVDELANIRLQRAVIATDVGRVIDVDGVKAQMEGGFLQAASWTLLEQVQFDDSGVTSRDWHSYPILGFDNVPELSVHVVAASAANEHPPLGAGEAVCGPAGAAIANAVFNAVGLRVRRLPLRPEALRAVAAS